MPNVEGKREAKVCQKGDVALWGHDMPERKSKGTEAKTTISITFSRCLTNHERDMLKKMTDRMRGRHMQTSSLNPAKAGKRKNLGMPTSR